MASSRSSIRAAIATILLVRLLSVGVWSLEDIAQNQQVCTSTDLKANPSPNSTFFDTFLRAYTATVDTFVGIQTKNWNFVNRYRSFDESKEGLCERNSKNHLKSNVPRFERSVKEETQPNSSTIFEYDRESDIDSYFNELITGCSKPIPIVDERVLDEDALEFSKNCLTRLQSLVFEPRCTTRYDSRVICNGEAPSNIRSPSELIQQHFDDPEALNIVIVGAGPVGLMLGNSLAMLPKIHTDMKIPPIRTLFLETRADSNGTKRPYTRNWPAYLSSLLFKNRMDSRFWKIAMSMVGDEDLVLPLNCIETLLLLSNRDLGNKFLFGINPLDLVEDLQKIPNLVLVDATGHRLEPLRRGPVCDEATIDISKEDLPPEHRMINHSTPIPPEIPWMTERTSEFYENVLTFLDDWSHYKNFAVTRGHELHVAQSGSVLYPIHDATMVPKTFMCLDIHGATSIYSGEMFNVEMQLGEVSNALIPRESTVCQWCQAWYQNQNQSFTFYEPYTEEDSVIDGQCADLCYISHFFISRTFLRDDIADAISQNMLLNTFINGNGSTDGWFPIQFYSLRPSPVMAKITDKVLIGHGFKSHPNGMPLKEFYAAFLNAIDQEGADLCEDDKRTLQALERYSKQSRSAAWPTVTMYANRPFIYTNGIKTKNYHPDSTNLGDYLDAPMIRIGDSFTVGDVQRKCNW